MGLALSFGLAATVSYAQQPATATAPAAAIKPVSAEQGALEAEVLKASKQLMDAFNNGSVDGVLGVFLPDGELIDDSGTVHLGHEELKSLVSQFFAAYPGAKT